LLALNIPPSAAAQVAAAQTTTSTPYTHLATVGPAVTLETGTTVLVVLAAEMKHNGVRHYMSVAISGATTTTAATVETGGGALGGVVLARNDGVAILGQTTAADDGLDEVNASGRPTRISECDASAEVLSGTLISISEGTANKDSIWQLTTNAPITIGWTSL